MKHMNGELAEVWTDNLLHMGHMVALGDVRFLLQIMQNRSDIMKASGEEHFLIEETTQAMKPIEKGVAEFTSDQCFQLLLHKVESKQAKEFALIDERKSKLIQEAKERMQLHRLRHEENSASKLAAEETHRIQLRYDMESFRFESKIENLEAINQNLKAQVASLTDMNEEKNQKIIQLEASVCDGPRKRSGSAQYEAAPWRAL